MGQARLVLEEHFPVQPEALWDVLMDHEALGTWIGARVTVVTGPPDGGVGTVRRVHAGPLSFDEVIVYADRPTRFVYRIVRGVPGLKYHRAEVLLRPWGRTGVQLRWDTLLVSYVPVLAQGIAQMLRGSLTQATGRLRIYLDEQREERGVEQLLV